MRIRVYGIPQNLDRRTVFKAVRYFSRFLMSEPLLQNISLRIDFGSCRGFKAELALEVQGAERPRRFHIRVRDSLGSLETLEAIAHELVHVKQYATGQMKAYVNDDDHVRWESEIWEAEPEGCEDERYWFAPWEIEARGLERGLAKTFLLHHKK